MICQIKITSVGLTAVLSLFAHEKINIICRKLMTLSFIRNLDVLVRFKGIIDDTLNMYIHSCLLSVIIEFVTVKPSSLYHYHDSPTNYYYCIFEQKSF